MINRLSDEDWRTHFGHGVQPFIDALGHKAQRRWAPIYLQGLPGPGERKSVQPMSQRVAAEDLEQLHHFIATSAWNPQPLHRELIQPTQTVYSENVREIWPRANATGRPRKHPELSHRAYSERAMIARHGKFRRVSWRQGTRRMLSAEFARVRVRVADEPERPRGPRRPGEYCWLVCERRSSGERKSYLTSHESDSSLRIVAAAIKARWSCEQAHQQLKEELGLDNFKDPGLGFITMP